VTLGSVVAAAAAGLVYGVVPLLDGRGFWMRTVVGTEADRETMVLFGTVHAVYGVVLGGFLGAGPWRRSPRKHPRASGRQSLADVLATGPRRLDASLSGYTVLSRVSVTAGRWRCRRELDRCRRPCWCRYLILSRVCTSAH